MNSLVTISIPTYNSAFFLEKCLKAVLNQTYKNIEINIIDGSSKDSTVLIANKYNARVINYLGALLGARFEGLKAANGEYVLLLDSDQILEKTCIERAVAEMENAKDMLILEEDVYRCDNFLEKLFHYDRKLIHEIKDFDPATSVMLPRFYRTEMLKKAFVNIPIDVLQNVGGQDHAIIYLEAWNINHSVDLLPNAVKHIEPNSLGAMWRKFYRWGYTSVGAKNNKYTDLLNKKERFRKGLFKNGLWKESVASILLLLIKGVPYKIGYFVGKFKKYRKEQDNEIEERTHPYYKFVKKYLELNNKDIFLDIGCGTAGFCSVLQKKEDVGVVIGLDMSKDNLREARKKNDKLNLVLGTIFNLPFKKNVITKCIALEILEHLGNKNNVLKALKEIHFVLGNEQKFIMTTPNKGRFFRYIFLDPVSWLGRHHHFSKGELSKLLTDSNLKIEKMETIGGPLFVIFFYVIYWRVRRWGLLKFGLIKSFFNFIIYRTELEFEKQNKDGCMFIIKAKKQELLKEENVASISNKITNLWGCPKCKGDVVYKGMFLTCNSCKFAYPILNGNIPNMLIKEAWSIERAEKYNFEHSLKL